VQQNWREVRPSPAKKKKMQQPFFFPCFVLALSLSFFQQAKILKTQIYNPQYKRPKRERENSSKALKKKTLFFRVAFLQCSALMLDTLLFKS
jgi:hypothetical protein